MTFGSAANAAGSGGFDFKASSFGAADGAPSLFGAPVQKFGESAARRPLDAVPSLVPRAPSFFLFARAPWTTTTTTQRSRAVSS